MNPAGLRMMGMTDEAEVCGLTYVDIPIPEDRERISHLMARAWRGEGSKFNFAVQGEDELLHFSSSFEPSPDTAGRVVKLMGVTEDITDRINRERALEDKVRLLDTIIESMSDGISVRDENLNAVAFNSNFLKLMDLPAKKFAVGDPHKKFIQFNADRGEYGDGNRDEIIQGRIEIANSFEPFEEVRNRPDGTKILIKGNPLRGGGFVTLYSDVTQRKLFEQNLRDSEERFRSVFENSHIGMTIQDADGRRLAANQAMCDMLGRSKAELENSYDWEFTHPGDVELSKAHIRTLTSLEEDKLEFNKKFLRKDGEVVFASVNISKIGSSSDLKSLVISQVIDITEQSLSEIALRESAKNFRHLVEGSSHGFAVHDNLRPVFVNESLAHMFKYTTQEMLDLASFLEMLAPNERDRMERASEARASSRRAPTQFEAQGVCKDGSTIWLHISAHSVFWEGRHLRAASILDITERKSAESALFESNERYRELAEGSLQGILVHRDLKPLYANDAFGTIFNYQSVDQVLKLDSTLELVHEDDKDMIRDRAFRRASRETLDPLVEYKGLTADGRMNWVESMSRVVRWDDGDAILSTFMDITDRKRAESALLESEERYRFLTEDSLYGIVVHRNHKILYANNTLSQMFGYGAVDDVLGLSSIGDLGYGEDKKRIEGRARKRGTGNPISERSEFRGVKADGTLIWFETSGKTIQWDGADAIQAIVLDITERKQLEEHLLKAQRIEAIGNLTGGVAHDFNNIMAIMSGNAEMLEDHVGENMDAKVLVSEIKRAVDRGSSLTNRLLAFSRQQTLSPATTNVSNLIAGLEDLLRRTIGEAIILDVERAPELWYARMDSHQFENALVNLALNARDAMAGGGTLTINSSNAMLDNTYAEHRSDVTPGEYVKVTVSDTGVGIPADIHEKVFEPFFTTKGIGEGSGLGLSMVYGFVKQSNGHIAIHSEVDRGTTFELYLPRSRHSPADDKPDNPANLERGVGRILLVEDNEGVKRMAARTLRDHGFNVVEASDGPEALNCLETNEPFDLLFTDIILPGGMDGLEIADAAKRIQPGIKVLCTSGYAERTKLTDSTLGPSPAVLNKPYRRAELLEKVFAQIELNIN